jgi:hypothetical protein
VWYEFEIPKKKKKDHFIIKYFNQVEHIAIFTCFSLFICKKKGKPKPIKPLYKRCFAEAGNPI